MHGKAVWLCQDVKKAATGREGLGCLLRRLAAHATAAASCSLPLGLCSCSALCLEGPCPAFCLARHWEPLP